MAEVIIRRADGSDADTLSALAAHTFSDTFAHLYPPADLAAYVGAAYDPAVTRAELSAPRTAFWMMETDGKAIGYAMAGPCGLPHPDVTARCGELKRIYLLRNFQGGGRGGRLLNLALGWLSENGFGTQWLGVWSENFGAQRLYARLGFEKVGEYQFRVGETLDREFIMRRG